MPKVAVVGSGLIGRAWSMIFARAGWDVALSDPFPEARAEAVEACGRGLAILAGQGLCDDPEAAHRRITASASLAEALEGADYVQENGPESLDVKKALFAEMDALCPPATILASSTSAIQCSLFTEDLPGRNRCLVAHPVNPPHLIPVVELSGAPWTDPDVIARARAILEEIGQAPIVVRKEIDGFILNRIQTALLSEAFRLVEEGYVSPQDLDLTVSQGLGLRWSFMGPFETISLNAPGGVPDYCARYSPFFRRFSSAPAGAEVWDEERVRAACEAWGPPLSPAEQAEKTRWRDQRLAALAVHKSGQDGFGGEASGGS